MFRKSLLSVHKLTDLACRSSERAHVDPRNGSHMMAGMDVEVGIRITRCVKIAYTTAEVIRSTLLPIPVLASAITNLHPELVLRAKKYSVKFPAALMHRLCRFAYSSRTGFHLA